MSVVAALYSGISGIVSNGAALAVSGDNIANISTPAFKSSAAVFESALVQRIGSAEIGLGTRLGGTSANFTQGAFANTTRATDLAIQGRGFFAVDGTGGDRFYTRAGAFLQNSDGKLVTASGGYLLQGYSIDSSGAVSGTLDDIDLLGTTSTPTATSAVTYSLNLNASEGTPNSTTFTGTTFANAESTSDFNVTTNVYDSLGVSRTLVTYFRHLANNQWAYHTLTAGSNLENYGGASGGTVVVDEGLVTFTSSGNLSSVSRASGALAGFGPATLDANGTLVAGERINTFSGGATTIQWAGGATAQAMLTFDFGQVSGSTAISTQYASPSAVSLVSQDGQSAGDLQSIEITAAGVIKGSFSNGQTRDIYKIPLAIFPNDEGLTRSGNNLYAASSNSGDAQISDAQTAGRGDVRSFSLEQSNTDLAAEFVKIIGYQRAFQASSRTVQTAAELLQDLVRIGQ